eukprot:3220119-Rhodomonas_salina.1
MLAAPKTAAGDTDWSRDPYRGHVTATESGARDLSAQHGPLVLEHGLPHRRRPCDPQTPSHDPPPVP